MTGLMFVAAFLTLAVMFWPIPYSLAVKDAAARSTAAWWSFR
jgi:hypothetical protein